jgi:hypothetical protein
MAAPRGSFSPPFTRMEPSRGPKEAVFSVGSHVIARPHGQGADRLTLTAEDGHTALATVKAGAEVEITAWRPRRSGPALYRVRGRSGGAEGWTTASSLERLPPPPPSPSRAPAAVPTASAKRPVPKTAKRPRAAARTR